MDFIRQAKALEPETIMIRRHIHRFPELSNEEFQTLAYIKQQLSGDGIDSFEIEGGGILGFIGNERRGPTILLRADIDALPILESACNLNQKKTVVSDINGIHHACGHDAHTAILLTAGKLLKQLEDSLPGRVILLFERGEEGGNNLAVILRYLRDTETEINGAHAIHVNPALSCGKFAIRKGPVLAGVCGFNATISGCDGHGSRPDLSNNPIDCFVSVYETLQSFRLRHISPYDAFTFSVGRVSSGNKKNIIPRDLTFEGTARYLRPQVGEKFAAEFNNCIDNIVRAYGCTCIMENLVVGKPVINDEGLASLAQRTAVGQFGPDTLVDIEPQMSSESFSQIALRYPSVMVWLGVGNEMLGSGANLHTACFDIDEEALHLGVAETVSFTLSFLNES